MPTIHYEQGFRFSFYSSDRQEPPHVHVAKGGHKAKWWISPIGEAVNLGFNRRDQSTIRRIIEANQGKMLVAWRAYFPPAP